MESDYQKNEICGEVLWMGFFFFFLKCGSGRIELLVRTLGLLYHVDNLNLPKSNDNGKYKRVIERGREWRLGFSSGSVM